MQQSKSGARRTWNEARENQRTEGEQKEAPQSVSEPGGNVRSEHEAKDKPTNEALALRAKTGDREALAALWEQNRPLLGIMFRRLAAKSRERTAAAGVTLDDLEQEGFFATVKAVELYEPQSGAKFSTFLRYPVMQRFFAAVGLRTSRQKGDPLSRAQSLDEPLDSEDGDGAARGELVPDPAAAQAFQSAEERLYNKQLHKALDECLDAIDARQAAVLRGRYYEGRTQGEIAGTLGVAPQRAQQLERMGLRAMRHKGTRRLAQYREEITSRAYRGTGFAAWKQGGSAPERWAEWAEAKEVQRRRAEDKRFFDELARFEEECGIWTDEPGD